MLFYEMPETCKMNDFKNVVCTKMALVFWSDVVLPQGNIRRTSRINV